MKLSLRELAEGAVVLAGSRSGQRVFTRLLEKTTGPTGAPEPLFLDFTGIEVATASFLRESVLAFRNHVRGRRSRFYPVIANATEAVRDELLEVVRPRGGALMACTLASDNSISETMLIGELEPKQRLTFDLVSQRGETDAGELMRNTADTVQHTTAWNNRLSALADLGLVMEVTQGRTKRYRALLGTA